MKFLDLSYSHTHRRAIGGAAEVKVGTSGLVPASQENREISAVDVAVEVQVGRAPGIARLWLADQRRGLGAAGIPAEVATLRQFLAHECAACGVGAEGGIVGFEAAAVLDVAASQKFLVVAEEVRGTDAPGVPGDIAAERVDGADRFAARG